MSEEEAIKILKEITPDDLLNCWEGGEKEFEAIETILDLYKQEKENNKKLSEEITERICKNVEAEVFEEMRLELKHKKHQIKEIQEEFLKYNWKTTKPDCMYNQVKSLYESIFGEVKDE